jgi:hypothetical protein
MRMNFFSAIFRRNRYPLIRRRPGSVDIFSHQQEGHRFTCINIHKQYVAAQKERIRGPDFY